MQGNEWFWVCKGNNPLKLVNYLPLQIHKVRKRATIRNRYNQAPHLTQDNNGEVPTSQLDITDESQVVSPFPYNNLHPVCTAQM